MPPLPPSLDLPSLLALPITIRSLPLSRVYTGTFVLYDHTGTVVLRDVEEIRLVPHTIETEGGEKEVRTCRLMRRLPHVSINREMISEVLVEEGVVKEAEERGRLRAKERERVEKREVAAGGGD